MTSRILVAAVGAGCVVAAGLGGYVATRSATTGSAAEAAPLTMAQASVSGETPLSSSSAQVAPTRSQERPVPAPRAARAERSQAPAAGPADVAATEPQSNQRVTTEQADRNTPVPVMDASSSESAPAPAAPSVEPAPARFEEVEIAADAVVGISLRTAVSSETSRVEDRITGTVTRDVKVDGRTVVPAGAQIAGQVTLVQPGGKMRERARVGIRFTSLLIDDVRIPIETEAIYRDGDAPGGEATAKIGASAVIGSILGGVFGGKKGAAIGGAAGAAGGTAVVMNGERNAATLPAGTPLTVRLSSAATIRLDSQR